MKLFLRFLVASASVLFLSISAYAGEVVLKFHSFPPMPANSNAKFVKPWSEKVLAESNGEIKVEIYPAMQLGGKPPQLVDQVRDGVVVIVWTVAGYTPGRFPHLEAFELPFLPTKSVITSQSFHLINFRTSAITRASAIRKHTFQAGQINYKQNT